MPARVELLSWLRWDGEHEGQCLDANITYTLAFAINVDVVEDADHNPPIPLTFYGFAQLSWKKKWPVSVMFAVGIVYERPP